MVAAVVAEAEASMVDTLVAIVVEFLEGIGVVTLEGIEADTPVVPIILLHIEGFMGIMEDIMAVI